MIMQFLRFGLVVEEKEVLAVVLTDIAQSLSYSIAEIKDILDGICDKMCQKDFLRIGAHDPVIKRKK